MIVVSLDNSSLVLSSPPLDLFELEEEEGFRRWVVAFRKSMTRLEWSWMASGGEEDDDDWVEESPSLAVRAAKSVIVCDA